MFVFFVNTPLQNTMAEQNVPNQPPTRTDEQIVPRSQWLTIGKSNLLFNAQKIQKNPIFQISVDILSNTNFFQAFTASANVPAIYLQQFWNTMKYNEKTGVYSCQVDEQWFDLSADLLRKALAITPVIPAQPFELPPSGNTVIDFVNELGYPEPVEIVSNIRVNYVYQPWRAILTLINQCLTGKTSGSDKPRHPVLQMLWGIVTQTNVDHAELIWEEFTQGIQTFFSHKASHKASLKNPKKKVSPLLIPYGRFSKEIFKFVPKGESVECLFGMAIPSLDYEPFNDLILSHVSENGCWRILKKTLERKTSTRKLRKGNDCFPTVTEEDEASTRIYSSKRDDDPDFEMVKKLNYTSEKRDHESSSTSRIQKEQESDTEKRCPKDDKADEDAMDKEVADKVKDHKRKHDSDDDEDDDDDEGPSSVDKSQDFRYSSRF
ncbi:hypothetical protein Tco_1154524 [Tanacetum coccineum]